MQITLDVSRLVLRFLEKMDPTGVDRVTLAYVRHFSKTLPLTMRALIRWRGLSGMFSAARSQELFALLLRGHRDAEAEMTACLLRGIVSTWFNGDGSRSLLLQTAHQDAESKAFWRNLRWHSQRTVFFVYELIPLTHPQYCREGDALLHRERLLRMRNGVALMANSQASKSGLDDFFLNAGFRPPPITVGALGCDTRTPKLIANEPNSMPAIGQFSSVNEAKNGLQEPAYFVCLGTIELRKNHRLLLNALRQLLAKTQAQGARALLFPTYTEGFGLPLTEALASGLSAIANDPAVLSEFVGDVPEYLPPDGAQLWAQAVQDYANDTNRRHVHLGRLATWQPASWEAHFAAVMTWLEALWQQHIGAGHAKT
jgi:hypothetical protein